MEQAKTLTLLASAAASLLFFGALESCGDKRETNVRKSDEVLKRDVRIDMLIEHFDGVEYKNFNRDFSFRIEDEFRNKVMVTTLQVRDIAYVDKDVSLIVGSNLNSVFKIYLSNEDLPKIDTLRPSFHRYAVAIGYVTVKKLFEFESEPDDNDQLKVSLGLHRAQYLIQGELMDIRY